ncbi:MAG: hypothetical protein EPN61_12040 [Burkholderiaceae bacterium]|nr:MAG: hypothetical protein EPN61_12040 [Burkholderiaceae bacterium]
MSKFSSVIQILLVETNTSKALNPKTNEPYVSTQARAILLGEDGTPVTVGRLRVPRALVDVVKPGTFTAAFTLGVPDFGDDKGDIVAQLTGLSPVVSRAAPAAPTK